MQNAESVIVDTSVWVDYLRGRNQAQRDTVATLVQQGQAYICGVVLAELLAGTRTVRDRDRIDTLFRGLPYLELSRPTWVHAGNLASAMRAQGITVPLADLLIATLALEHGLPLFTHGAHFQRIPRLRLYQPA